MCLLNLGDNVHNVKKILGALRKWAQERRKLAGSLASDLTARRSLGDQSSVVHERIVVLNKRDLVPEWGIQVS